MIKGFFPIQAHIDAQLPAGAFHQSGRQRLWQGILAADGHILLQNPGGYGLAQSKITDVQIPFGGPGIHGELPFHIRGCGDHRLRLNRPGQPDRQGVGPADVAGKKGHHKGPPFVHHQHTGILFFVRYPGGDGTDRHTGGPNEQNLIRPGKIRLHAAG